MIFFFLTIKGSTFQPDPASIEQDIENLQIIGFSSGVPTQDAFEQLIKKTTHILKQTSFNEIIGMKLADP